ncbi:MAG: MarR family winged helix-turn-helix transcriptional regulator [Lachnospiraceae bacterium]
MSVNESYVPCGTAERLFKYMNQDFSKIGRSIAIIDRLMKMYYEKALAEFEIGWGQQFYLEVIHQKPGITLQQLAQLHQVDKATVTKVIKFLENIDYITLETNPKDKRIRHVYITEKAKPAVLKIKEVHKRFYQDLTEQILETDVQNTNENLEIMIDNIKQHIWHRMSQRKGE